MMRNIIRGKVLAVSASAVSILVLSIPAVSQAMDEDDLAVGKQTYEQACMMCHASGMAGAPRVDRPDEWENRLGDSIDPLVQNTIGGLGNMPPQGGPDEEEVRLAVKYMLHELGLLEELAEQ
ncbi:c-type cytochrome [Methylonatrum kenyense]|uniref:c-type cytochrome n=1 Tax=Methylonatrum kenyense TaxID=455253 RepID=UPI0020BF773E|nr:c-type cytochrome [Methylonatrum kenyense]MCK8517357.1 c-type cytochrome [Methylonatrum kenyense]